MAAAAAALVLAGRLGWSRRWEEARRLTGGQPEHAPQLIVRHGCGGCHTGVAMAHGQVGPNFEGIGACVYIAGRITNTPDQLIAFITNPSALAPGPAMPERTRETWLDPIAGLPSAGEPTGKG